MHEAGLVSNGSSEGDVASMEVDVRSDKFIVYKRTAAYQVGRRHSDQIS